MSSMVNTFTIYVLYLEDEKYYVGRANDVIIRFKEHLKGYGPPWIKKYKPLSIKYKVKNDEENDEDKHVKKCMMEYGIKNVRGGSYHQIKLSKAQIKTLKEEIKTGKFNTKSTNGSNNFENKSDNPYLYQNPIKIASFQPLQLDFFPVLTVGEINTNNTNTTTNNTIYVRDKPSTQGKNIGMIGLGQSVDAIDIIDGYHAPMSDFLYSENQHQKMWIEIVYNDDLGYIKITNKGQRLLVNVEEFDK